MNEHLCFEKIVTHIQISNKNNQEFPYITCNLIIQLLKSRYKEQTIIELPILKLISQFYQSENSPIKIDDYLFIAFTVLQTGEMIYPDRYVGEFLKYQGESIIQDIQKILMIIHTCRQLMKSLRWQSMMRNYILMIDFIIFNLFMVNKINPQFNRITIIFNLLTSEDN